MIFERETIAFQIFDVLYLEQGNVNNTVNCNRNFDALSFRIESDAVVESGNSIFELDSNCIGYFPSSVKYVRSAKTDKCIVIHFKVFDYHSHKVECFKPENPEKYLELFRKILDCWNRRSASYKHEASAILYEIFACMYEENKPLKTHVAMIEPAIEYIEKNMFRKDFLLSEAAGKSMVSEVYFRKLFKAEFGISPKKYIIKSRINRAASLISSGYFALAEIADMCGYDDYKHFSSEFKKQTGVSPSGYAYNYNKNGETHPETPLHQK